MKYINTKITNNRDGNLDVLRILAAFGVIILHYNDSYGGALSLVNRLSISFFMLSVFEAISLYVVNVCFRKE